TRFCQATINWSFRKEPGWHCQNVCDLLLCRHVAAVRPLRALQRLSVRARDHQPWRVAVLSLRGEPARRLRTGACSWYRGLARSRLHLDVAVRPGVRSTTATDAGTVLEPVHGQTALVIAQPQVPASQDAFLFDQIRQGFLLPLIEPAD